jgi:hypothetical protein
VKESKKLARLEPAAMRGKWFEVNDRNNPAANALVVVVVVVVVDDDDEDDDQL